MEIIEKQVEKVKEVPTDGCYGYGYGRRDINGKANAGLTLGIIGTALGAWALFGNRRGSGLLGLAGSGMGGSNININGLETGLGTANGITSPSAFQAWEKSCEDALALQGAIYTQALNYQNNRFADRQTLNSELFSLWKGQVDADFGLYKSTRDGFDVMAAKQNQDAFNLYKSQRDADDSIRKEMENLMTTNPFTFKTSFVGDIEIGGGEIKFNLPLTNKKLVLDMTDLETFKEMLITKD